MIKIDGENWIVVTPWYDARIKEMFCEAWDYPSEDELLMMQDTKRVGPGVMKNRLVTAALEMGADGVVVLDDDCYPDGIHSLHRLVHDHVKALRPQPVPMFKQVTDPPSRGTPYHNLTIEMPVAASMGFWTKVGDYDACGQLVHGPTKPMEFDTRPVFGQYFPLCGMNLAFRPIEWQPWCQFIDVSRFDDIWQGWLWQKEAYRRGFCFNLGGPLVRHSRMSNVWANLRDEAKWLEESDTLWRKIATADSTSYEKLRKLLPV